MENEQQEDEGKNNEKNNIIFTYTEMYDIKKERFVKIDTSPIALWMNASSYTTIYSHLPFLDEDLNQLDDKYDLYQLYKDDPYASQVFPKSYGSWAEALHDTSPEAENGDNIIFYLKRSVVPVEKIFI